MRILVNHPGPNWSVADVYRGWVGALKQLGVETIEYAFHDRLWFFQNAQIEQDGKLRYAAPFDTAVRLALEGLGAALYEDQPNAVLFVSGFWMRPETFDGIRARGQQVILLCTESPYDDDKQIELAEHADITIINDPLNLDRFRQVCPKTIYAPHSYNPTIHYPGPGRPELASDFCMIGTGYGSRIKFLEEMRIDELDIALLGNWQMAADTNIARFVRASSLDECVDNHVAADWYRSTRASLNLYRTDHSDGGTADGIAMGPREVELAACGTFFLTQARPENRAVLPMVPVVEDPGDAAAKLRWFLQHDQARQRVTDAARSAIADWTFDNRARELLRALDT